MDRPHPNTDLIVNAISKELIRQSGITKLPFVLHKSGKPMEPKQFIINAIKKTVLQDTGIAISLEVLAEISVPYILDTIDLVLILSPDPSDPVSLLTPNPTKNFRLELPDFCRAIFKSTKVRGLQKAALNFNKIQFVNSDGNPLFWVCFGMHRHSSYGKSYIKNFESTCWNIYST